MQFQPICHSLRLSLTHTLCTLEKHPTSDPPCRRECMCVNNEMCHKCTQAAVQCACSRKYVSTTSATISYAYEEERSRQTVSELLQFRSVGVY